MRWLPDGIELVGTSTDHYYAPGGALVLSAYLTRTRIIRDEDEIVVTKTSEKFGLAEAPDGTQLPMPNFSKPIGEPSKTEIRGEAINDITDN